MSSLSSNFTPTPFVGPREPDDSLYTPAASLAEALRAFAEANEACRRDAVFSNVANACRACRTGFAAAISEILTVGPAARTRLLDDIEPLLSTCRTAVEQALPGLTGDELVLARDYLKHIADRIQLADLLRRGGISAYMIEIERRLAGSRPPLTPA